MSQLEIKIGLREYMLSLVLAYVSAKSGQTGVETSTFNSTGTGSTTASLNANATLVSSSSRASDSNTNLSINDDMTNLNDILIKGSNARLSFHMRYEQDVYGKSNFRKQLVVFGLKHPSAFLTFLPVANAVLATNAINRSPAVTNTLRKLDYLDASGNSKGSFTKVLALVNSVLAATSNASNSVSVSKKIFLTPSFMYVVANNLAEEYNRKQIVPELAAFLNGAKSTLKIHHGYNDKDESRLSVPAAVGAPSAEHYSESDDFIAAMRPATSPSDSASEFGAEEKVEEVVLPDRPPINPRLSKLKIILDELKIENSFADDSKSINVTKEDGSIVSFGSSFTHVEIQNKLYPEYAVTDFVQGVAIIKKAGDDVGEFTENLEFKRIDVIGGDGDEDDDADEIEHLNIVNDYKIPSDGLELNDTKFNGKKIVEEAVKGVNASLKYLDAAEKLMVEVNGVKLMLGNRALHKFVSKVSEEVRKSGSSSGSYGDKQWEFKMTKDKDGKTIIVLKKSGTLNDGEELKKFTLRSDDNATCAALGLEKLQLADCSNLMAQCDSDNPSKCLKKLVDAFSTAEGKDISFGLSDLARVNPETGKKFLRKLGWGRLMYEIKDKNRVEWNFNASWDEQKKKYAEKNVEIPDVLKQDPNHRSIQYLIALAKYINKVYPEALNHSIIEKDVEPEDQDELKRQSKTLRYPIHVSSQRIVPLPGLGLTDTKAYITSGIVRQMSQVAGPMPFINSFAGPVLRVGQSGGELDKYGIDTDKYTEASKESAVLPGLRDMENFYNTTVKNFDRRFKSMGKELHSDVKTTMRRRLDDFKDSAKEFSEKYNLVRRYVKRNSYGPRDTKIAPNAKEMEEYNKSFEKSAAKFAIKELNVLKLIGTLSNGLSKVTLEVANNSRDKYMS